MKIKCPLCGFENEEGSKFCKNCNEPLYDPDINNTNRETDRKKQIEEEEKIRAEARARAEKEVKEKKQKEDQKNKGIGCLVLIGLVIIFYFVIFGGGGGDKEEETESSLVHLNASVSFTGTQFVIVNDDNYDWVDIKMEVNGSLLKSGFILKTNRMEAGETYTVGALQFAKNDGTRFNPTVYKPKSFTISCDTPDGENAFWSGGWE